MKLASKDELRKIALKQEETKNVVKEDKELQRLYQFAEQELRLILKAKEELIEVINSTVCGEFFCKELAHINNCIDDILNVLAKGLLTGDYEEILKDEDFTADFDNINKALDQSRIELYDALKRRYL